MPSDMYYYMQSLEEPEKTPWFWPMVGKTVGAWAFYGTIENTAERLQKQTMSNPNQNKTFLSSLPKVGKPFLNAQEWLTRKYYGTDGKAVYEQFQDQGIKFKPKFDNAQIGMLGKNKQWKKLEEEFGDTVSKWKHDQSITKEQRKAGKRLIRRFNFAQAINNYSLYEMSEIGYSIAFNVSKSLFFDSFVERGKKLEMLEEQQEGILIKSDISRNLQSQYDENYEKSMYRRMQLQEMSNQYIIQEQQGTIKNISNPYIMYRM